MQHPLTRLESITVAPIVLSMMQAMFGGLPPAIQKKLVAGVLAARITVTAGLAVISGQMVATLAGPAWQSMAFAVTASTASFAVWSLSARIVPPVK